VWLGVGVGVVFGLDRAAPAAVAAPLEES
jgi:hypothetical protein